MPIDIHMLDELEQHSSQFERKFAQFIKTMLEQFFEAPEGQLHLQAFEDAGFWAERFISLNYDHLGVSLSRMNVRDVEEVVAEIFPRKITLPSPEEADEAIPELMAFWRYLQREYKLTNAEPILEWLNDFAPKFKDLMNDPRKFGIAKSFMTLGQSMGYDMTKQADVQTFMLDYNSRLLAESEAREDNEEEEEEALVPFTSLPGQQRQISRKAIQKKKNKRKMATASRKKNRKKK